MQYLGVGQLAQAKAIERLRDGISSREQREQSGKDPVSSQRRDGGEQVGSLLVCLPR